MVLDLVDFLYFLQKHQLLPLHYHLEKNFLHQDYLEVDLQEVYYLHLVYKFLDDHHRQIHDFHQNLER